MRDVEFRAWSNVVNKMFPGRTLHWTGRKFVIPIYDYGEIKIVDILDENPIILQYTWKKDENKIKIFEGDILIDSVGKKYIVKWGEKEAGFYLYETSTARTFYFYNFENEATGLVRLKIVGNIFYNPELLKEV